MENKKCENIINRYLQLDKDERLPLDITIHLLLCKSCRNKVRMLTMAEKQLSKYTNKTVKLTDSSIQAVIKEVAPETYEKLSKNPISLFNWIIGGIITISFLVISVIYASEYNNTSLTIGYAFVSAVAIVTYCSAFVMSNIDFFIKKISIGTK